MFQEFGVLARFDALFSIQVVLGDLLDVVRVPRCRRVVHLKSLSLKRFQLFDLLRGRHRGLKNSVWMKLVRLQVVTQE